MYFIQINQIENLFRQVYVWDAGNISIGLLFCLSALQSNYWKTLILQLVFLSTFRWPNHANHCAVVDRRQTEPQTQKAEIKEHSPTELWGINK